MFDTFLLKIFTPAQLQYVKYVVCLAAGFAGSHFFF